MRVQRFGVAFATVGFGILVMNASSCKPDGGINDGLAPVYELGVSELQFVSPCENAAVPNGPTSGFQPAPTTDVVAQVPVPLPFSYRAWRGSALEADPETCTTQGVYPTGFCAPYLPANTTQGFDIPDNNLSGLSAAAPSMCVRYASTIVHTDPLCDQQHALRQQEVLLFARDPEELYNTLSSEDYVSGFCRNNWANGTCGAAVDKQWNEETLEQPADPSSPVALPHAMSIPYPPMQNTPQTPVTLSGQAWSTNPLSVFDFWPRLSTLVGPGSGPRGASSVKAAKVVQHGFCSHYIDTEKDIFAPVADLLWTQYKQGVHDAGTCGCVTMWRDFIHMLSFLHQSEDVTTDQHGGFFLNFAVRNEFCGALNFTTDTARYNMAYEWQITSEGGRVSDMGGGKRLDGRPVIVPKFVGAHADGHDGSALEEKFFSSLNTTLPQDLYEVADRSLVYVGKTKLVAGQATFCPSGDADNCFPCKPRAPVFPGQTYPLGDATVPVVRDLTSRPTGEDLCNSAQSPFMWSLHEDVAFAAGRLGAKLSDDEISELQEEVFASHEGVYDRIRCNSYRDQTKNKDISRCEYLIPAKRVVVMPDQVELVFLDDDKEVSNPAYPIYLIAKLGSLNGNGSPMCDRARLCPDVGPTTCASDADCAAPGVTPAVCDAMGQCVAPVPPRYVTPSQPFFNRAFARLTIGGDKDKGTQCELPLGGSDLVCNVAVCAVASLADSIRGWISAKFF